VIVVFAGPPRTAIDDALEAAGATRHTAVVLSSFLGVPYFLAGSDAIAILPRPMPRSSKRKGVSVPRRAASRRDCAAGLAYASSVAGAPLPIESVAMATRRDREGRPRAIGLPREDQE
jgi:hypothetical protein